MQTPLPPVGRPRCGQTNTCENITLSQTSFAGGKYARKNSTPYNSTVSPQAGTTVINQWCAKYMSLILQAHNAMNFSL